VFRYERISVAEVARLPMSYTTSQTSTELWRVPLREVCVFRYERIFVAEVARLPKSYTTLRRQRNSGEFRYEVFASFARRWEKSFVAEVARLPKSYTGI
jgi:hypothetical protein